MQSGNIIYSKQIYQGGQQYNINTTLNDFPLFVKVASRDIDKLLT